MNKRTISLKKYGISSKRYKELCGFCEQYPEWKNKLKLEVSTLKGTAITDMPISHTNADVTANLAIERANLEEKCWLIEKTAKQASKDLAKYIIKAVCYEVPIAYLIACDNMPCSPASFYDTRRYFFYLLDQNKKM